MKLREETHEDKRGLMPNLVMLNVFKIWRVKKSMLEQFKHQEKQES
jgi:hypothetical protein